MPLNDTVHRVTERIRARSRTLRTAYLQRMARAADAGPARAHLSCGNLAHAFAASPEADKTRQTGSAAGNIGIVTAYNDMLSAHQPFEGFPALIREAARQAGGTAQVAGGVPAMCDGVTQGQPGMELSLFSRDVIALAAGVALSHNCFDAAIFLGVCDKIVPGLVIAAATFGHIPAIFAPAGPMTSGLPNDEKAAVRQRFARGEIGRDELMAAEMASYHGRRHLHVLWHGELEPDADGVHGPAPARRKLRKSRHAAARGADPSGGAAGARDHRDRQFLHAR